MIGMSFLGHLRNEQSGACRLCPAHQGPASPAALTAFCYDPQ